MLKIYYKSVVIFTIILLSITFMYMTMRDNGFNRKYILSLLVSCFLVSCVPILRVVISVGEVAGIFEIAGDGKEEFNKDVFGDTNYEDKNN